MANLKLVCVLLLCMVVGAPIAEALTCPQIQGNLASCLIYLKNGGTPTTGCCNGIRTVNNAAKTTADRQAACKCLKDTAGGVSGLNPNFATGLPSKCRINIPYKISTSTDCNKYPLSTSTKLWICFHFLIKTCLVCHVGIIDLSVRLSP